MKITVEHDEIVAAIAARVLNLNSIEGLKNFSISFKNNRKKGITAILTFTGETSDGTILTQESSKSNSTTSSPRENNKASFDTQSIPKDTSEVEPVIVPKAGPQGNNIFGD